MAARNNHARSATGKILAWDRKKDTKGGNVTGLANTILTKGAATRSNSGVGPEVL